MENLDSAVRLPSQDKETKRPRVNKYDSYLDREQKEQGEYYYLKEN